MFYDIVCSGKPVNRIQIDKSRGDRVLSRESITREFKESFNFSGLVKYSKTMAAFANHRGGCIIFGIKDRPQELSGLSPSVLDDFKYIKQERITGHLNDHFSPEIIWTIDTQKINGKHIGIIYVEESLVKPVICKNGYKNILKESDIYYRYRARTEVIKYAELKDIIEQYRKEEERKWMKLFNTVARIGVQDVGILDLSSGELSGVGNQTLLIDESLLSEVKFIKEGEFCEVSGTPTLKVIGEVSQFKAGITKQTTIEKMKSLQQGDIIKDFLNQKNITSPVEYIKSICNSSTWHLPCYYYIDLADLDIFEACDVIRNIRPQKHIQKKLLEKLESSVSLHKELENPGSESYNTKYNLKQKLIQETDLSSMLTTNKYHLFHAIMSLDADEVKSHKKYLCELLIMIYDEHYIKQNKTIPTNFRKAVCWIDEVLYLR